MRLGIDFGTTRTIVAWADRGNYPVVTFTDHDGDSRDHLPSVAAWRGADLVYGYPAMHLAATTGTPLVRSFKRLLASPSVTPHDTVEIDGRPYGLLDLVTGYASYLRDALRTTSNIRDGLTASDPIEAVVAVPAHAHGAQRFLTLEAFRRAGFAVVSMVNEPSAAGFEYTQRQGRTLNSKRTRVLVYDLGGGTFDASLVRVDGTDHDVLGSLGVNRLGGDDFDEVLAECALASAGMARTGLTAAQWTALLDQCRDAKEGLSPQTRRIAIDIDGAAADVQVEDFNDAATGLVLQTVDAMAPLVGGLSDEDGAADVAGIYLVGGASGLPLVPRVLRTRFGRRVHRSPHPAASTAIGLAIAGDETAGYSLTDRLSRGFGVFRERDSGHEVSFDPILSADERVSPQGRSGGLTRTYRAAHNVGWFRFVEYTRVDDRGQPVGDLAPFGELLFPFDAALQADKDLADVPVVRTDGGPLVQETYSIDPHGIVHATIADLDTGYSRTLALRAG
ncbi:Hsp70 family protein [Propionicicella superfundia]|uniref:Hsp70 family protein n=1 Tax=Propionicicella superfundia TaxID=348582 RepID=UPI0003F84F4D|nr:Hsp70 family protein [Propionicicella superfundia]